MCEHHLPPCERYTFNADLQYCQLLISTQKEAVKKLTVKYSRYFTRTSFSAPDGQSDFSELKLDKVIRHEGLVGAGLTVSLSDRGLDEYIGSSKSLLYVPFRTNGLLSDIVIR